MDTTHNQILQLTLQQNVWGRCMSPHVALLVPNKVALASDVVWEASDELDSWGIEAGLYSAEDAPETRLADLVLIDPLIDQLDHGLVAALRSDFPAKPILVLPSWQCEDRRNVVASLICYGLHDLLFGAVH